MGKLYCIMGKSASGKDSLYREILKHKPELHTYVMYSTRPCREGETDGVTYHFVKEADLRRFEEAGKLIEKRIYQTVNGPWIYATVDDDQIDLSRGSYLMHATLESYQKLRRYFGSEALHPIYIEVEDGERICRAVERERLEKKPNYRELCRRFLADDADFSEEKLKEAGIQKRYQNAEFDTCLKEILADIQ